jgi:hypothetical protein
MLDAILSIGAWVLVGIVIFLWGRWIELERRLFGHWHVSGDTSNGRLARRFP